MSKLFFVKYQGTGNDFILVDNRSKTFDRTLVPKICHRRFGIGADGVILLEEGFRMRIFNSDGSEPNSCGNGLRCFVQFLIDLGFEKQRYAIAIGDRTVYGQWLDGKIAIEMQVGEIQKKRVEDHEVYLVDSGVPHAVLFSASDFTLAPFFRNHPVFAPEGANVNFAKLLEDGSIEVRTFERGVEGETFACGTGAAAVAMVASKIYQKENPIEICFIGGKLQSHVDGSVVMIIGEVQRVFEGSIVLTKMI